jgi:hypothetical protein
MSNAGLDDRHRNHDGEISRKHRNTLVGALRKIYKQRFAVGYPVCERQSNARSLSLFSLQACLYG